MEKTTITLPAMRLIGISVRTNNDAESNWETGKIFPSVRRFFHQSLAEKIPHRKKPNTTLCVYTDYQSDHTGDYTYFIGEEVDSFDGCPEDLVMLTIPAQTYMKFQSGPAPMPEVVRDPWVKIVHMTPKELGGKRSFLADFELYDERAADHQNVVLDIFIGIEPA